MSLKKTNVITRGHVYAVTGGDFEGEFFIYIERTDPKTYCFLSLPNLELREVPVEKFSIGVDNKILQFQEKLPSEIFKVCQAQYDKNKKKAKSKQFNNRL